MPGLISWHLFQTGKSMLLPGWLPLLLAGELVHVGKYTSFGFGRYRIR